MHLGLSHLWQTRRPFGTGPTCAIYESLCAYGPYFPKDLILSCPYPLPAVDFVHTQQPLSSSTLYFPSSLLLINSISSFIRVSSRLSWLSNPYIIPQAAAFFNAEKTISRCFAAPPVFPDGFACTRTSPMVVEPRPFVSMAADCHIMQEFLAFTPTLISSLRCSSCIFAGFQQLTGLSLYHHWYTGQLFSLEHLPK